ncbi:MAG: HAMP domain-containing histidine kinase [Saprospiraceae bacterium]|nr:MAG: HAMP domain-containing histidine kinase [Saprospiraceae bacterium]
MTSLRLRLLSYLIMGYMFFAFAWWATLLFTKNRDVFYAKTDLVKASMMAEGLIKSESEFEATDTYKRLLEKDKSQEHMIIGEAMVFVFTLFAGFWFINKSYNEEVASNHQRRNFLLSITHELKSPIASIRLILETLVKRNLSKTQIEQLATSGLAENERLNELVENLLLSAKLETAYQPYFELLDLAALVRNIAGKMRAKFPEATFSFRQDADIPPIRGDKAGFTSALLNLCENAVKYSGEHPEVDIRMWTHAQKIVLEVADRGMGIPHSEKKRIFDKFYRVGNEETRQTKGTGLGLYIVWEVIKAHRGKITVTDNNPVGTVFSIELPLEFV